MGLNISQYNNQLLIELYEEAKLHVKNNDSFPELYSNFDTWLSITAERCLALEESFTLVNAYIMECFLFTLFGKFYSVFKHKKVWADDASTLLTISAYSWGFVLQFDLPDKKLYNAELSTDFKDIIKENVFLLDKKPLTLAQLTQLVLPISIGTSAAKLAAKATPAYLKSTITRIIQDIK